MSVKQDDEFWMILCRGKVQHYTYNGRKGMLLARTEKAARAFAKHMSKPDRRLSAAKIGTVPGETFECQVMAAQDSGVEGICVIDDESPTAFHWLDIPQE